MFPLCRHHRRARIRRCRQYWRATTTNLEGHPHCRDDNIAVCGSHGAVPFWITADPWCHSEPPWAPWWNSKKNKRKVGGPPSRSFLVTALSGEHPRPPKLISVNTAHRGTSFWYYTFLMCLNNFSTEIKAASAACYFPFSTYTSEDLLCYFLVTAFSSSRVRGHIWASLLLRLRLLQSWVYNGWPKKGESGGGRKCLCYVTCVWAVWRLWRRRLSDAGKSPLLLLLAFTSQGRKRGEGDRPDPAAASAPLLRLAWCYSSAVLAASCSISSLAEQSKVLL